MSPRARDERGQSLVELVALLPLAGLLALAVAQLLLAGLSAELAGHAAEAGAVALLEGDDPAAAARAALPGAARGRLEVEVRGRRVSARVRVPVLLPRVAALLEHAVTADAGPS